MSRLDVLLDKRAKLEKEAALLALYGGLEDGVTHAGGVLVGLSIKFNGFDCLLTLKAEFPAGMMVGFVGGDDLPHVIRKAAAEAVRDKVKWRQDKWRENGG
jgi:hypothetical protein